ncbi:MAG: 4Fe-4S binding protein [Sulfurovum sp.]|nr:4Fe-4S binding protein [Sulfurovum sp.]
MEKEYLYLESKCLEFPLDESIEVASEINSSHYIIANKDIANTEVFAYEIDYYIRNTEDDIAAQINNIKKLYDIRATVYDLAQDMDYAQKVGKKILTVLGEKNSELTEKLRKDGFTCIEMSPADISDINGHIGMLSVSTNKLMRGDLQVDQVIWYDAPDFAMKQSGVYDPKDIGWEEAIEALYENDGEFRYKNYVHYDPNICQYHGRILSETCGKCEDVCPSVAITKTDEDKLLHFSDIDCHGCGGCVSVCPSGALDFTQMPRDAFSEAASFYKNHIALILPAQVSIDDLSLPEKVLPFAIEGRKYLHESHFLALLQKSGHAVIFYTDFIAKGTGDVIRIINEIFERKYHKKAIHVCMNREELLEAFSQVESIEECIFDINDSDMKKREVFTYRLSHLVGDDDLGVIYTGEHVHYGSIKINESSCTLCMSCVGACNVTALTAHPEDNTLKFNPSICTNCGYCEVVCPEKDCVEIVYDELSLNSSYFVKNTMAHDELFPCIECGAEFATKKAIERIAEMMSPRFGNDEIKIRTLYCCADCKPKVMLQAHMDSKINNSTGVVA